MRERFGARFLGCAAAVVLAGVVAFGDDHDGQLPKSPAEALDWSKDFIEAARKAKSAETQEIAKGIRRAVDWMQPFVTKGSADEAWAGAWNEALTLTKFHKNKPTADYALEKHRTAGKCISIGMPKNRNWTFADFQNGEMAGNVCRMGPDGKTKISDILILMYSFNTVYSGIGGENVQALAKRSLDGVAGNMESVESKSPQLLVKPLSKALQRAQYFEVVGKSKANGPVRIREYFVKSANWTFDFIVTEVRSTQESDAPVDAWRQMVEDPELEAVLDSIEETDPKKAK